MKSIIFSTFLFFSFSLSAQEKGVSPLSERSPLDKTQNSSLETSSTYAVVIGISDYQDEGIPDLRFADKDAEAFANFLRSPAGGGLDKDHLKVLTNEQATVGQIDAALWWLVDECKEGDQVIIYFSGHGDVERRSISQPGFLLCWDAPPNAYMAGGTYSLFFLKEIVSTLSIQNKAKVMVVADACRSGKLAGSSIGGAQATAANLKTQYANEIKILSCQPNEYSIEGEQWGGGRGAFSYHLVDGLYGLADRNADFAVSLSELDRYLEDHISAEVAPHSQVPLTVGNRTETLALVSADMLEQVKQRKTSELPVFTKTDSRGIEEETLALVDSSTQEVYHAFKKALSNKVFLAPENACAEAYYKELINEPALSKLHNSMRRNYAAALQDDAQQVLNGWLKMDLQTMIISRKKIIDRYSPYPSYLERSAELLGEEHYMYRQLQARKLFFEAYLLEKDQQDRKGAYRDQQLSLYRKALQWQSDLPHVYFGMITVFGFGFHQLDSAIYYTELAKKVAPTWVLPYTRLAVINSYEFQDFEKAFQYLEKAEQIDSNDYTVHFNRGQLYHSSNQFDKAEEQFKRAIKIDSTVVPAYVQLGYLNTSLSKFEEAKKYLEKAVELNSTHEVLYSNLCYLNEQTRNWEGMQSPCKKFIELQGENAWGRKQLGVSYLWLGKYTEAEREYKKAIEMDPNNGAALVGLDILYRLKGQPEISITYRSKALNSSVFTEALEAGWEYLDRGYLEDAEEALHLSIELDQEKKKGQNGYGMACYLLAELYSLQHQPDKAIKWLDEALTLDTKTEDAIQRDERFDNIRNTPEFKTLMKNYFPDQDKD